MIGIVGILVFGFLAGAVIGVFTKSRIMRVIALCICGICAIGLLAFAYAITHFLQR